jgi:uncharacterized protein (TIGR02145 family)
MRKLNFLGRIAALAAIIAAGAVSTAAAQTTAQTPQPQPVSYGGKTYKTVVIGGKRWMAENLNYQTASGSICYDNDSSNCDKYGRLYDFHTAKTVCPAGWHLPSVAEWDNLASAAGGTRTKYKNNDTGVEFWGWKGAATTLKARSGWNNNGNNTDDFGFSALPGGYCYSNRGFTNAGNYGLWWTATEYGSDNAYCRIMFYKSDIVHGDDNNKNSGFSVRCVEDN